MRDVSDLRWRPGLTGGGVAVAGVALGWVLPTTGTVNWSAVTLVLLLGAGGGAVAGRLAGGTPRRRAYHGLVGGAVGGVAFGAVLWYTMVTPGAPRGAFFDVNYLLATRLPLPSNLAARYDALVPVVLGALGVALFAVEGALAGSVSGALRAYDRTR